MLSFFSKSFKYSKEVQLKNNSRVTLLSNYDDLSKVGYKKWLVYNNKLVTQTNFITRINPMQQKEAKINFQNKISAVKSNRSFLILVLDAQNIVGHIILNARNGRQGHIGDIGIAVLKEYSSIGIGRMLLEELVKIVKEHHGIKVISLEVSSENKIAMNLYKKFGFITIARIPKSFYSLSKSSKPKLVSTYIMHYYI